MKKSTVGLILIIILTACNMRAPFTGVGTLTTMIRADLGLSNTAAGMLTTIPMLVFAIISALSPLIASRIGLGRTILLSLILVLSGELIRSFTGTAGLFAGTAILCIGIGMENVLLISVVKQWFHDNPTVPTSAYSTTMSVTAALSIGASVFFARDLGLGWRGSLCVWALFAAAAIGVWIPLSSRQDMRPDLQSSDGKALFRLLRAPRTWLLTVFFGTQSTLFYCMTAWGPSILQSRGYTLDQASAAATFLQIISLPITLLAPFLAHRFTSRRMMVILGSLYLAGCLLYCFAPNLPLIYLALALYAQGMGSTFSFCLLFFARMGRNAEETAALSGIAQSGGYVVAAVGPVLMGALADISGAWNQPMVFLLVILIIALITGILSCREDTILHD